MDTRTVTRTLCLVTLMFNLGLTGVWAQQTHVNMTFSGNGAPSTINLPYSSTSTNEENVAGSGTLGWFTFRNVTAIAAASSQQPPKTCSGPTQMYLTRTAGAGIFRFPDESLMTVELTQGNDCIDLAVGEGHCMLTLKITGGTGRFANASGTLTYTEISKPVFDAFHNPVFFTETGKITGTVLGVAIREEWEHDQR